MRLHQSILLVILLVSAAWEAAAQDVPLTKEEKQQLREEKKRLREEKKRLRAAKKAKKKAQKEFREKKKKLKEQLRAEREKMLNEHERIDNLLAASRNGVKQVFLPENWHEDLMDKQEKGGKSFVVRAAKLQVWTEEVKTAMAEDDQVAFFINRGLNPLVNWYNLVADKESCTAAENASTNYRLGKMFNGLIQGRGYDAIDWAEIEDPTAGETTRRLGMRINAGSSPYLNSWIGNGGRRRRMENEEAVVEEKEQDEFSLDYTPEEMEIVIDELKLVIRNTCIDMIHDIALQSSGYTVACREALGRATCDAYIDKAEVAGVARGNMIHLAAETIDSPE